MTALFSSLWLPVGSLILGAIGVVFGLFKRQEAKSSKADASAAKSDAAAQVAQVQAQVSEANAAVADVVTTAVTNRDQAAAVAAATPDADLDAQLAQLGSLRKD